MLGKPCEAPLLWCGALLQASPDTATRCELVSVAGRRPQMPKYAEELVAGLEEAPPLPVMQVTAKAKAKAKAKSLALKHMRHAKA